jgi:hypothetical protein
MYVAIVSIEMRLPLKGIKKVYVGKYNTTWMVHMVLEFSADGAVDACFTMC